MKNDVPFVWDEACHNAFENIKKYLLSPPVLGAPVPGKPLILYIAAQESSKLKHYMHAHTIHLVAKADPIKYVMSKPVLTGRLAKWALLLNQIRHVQSRLSCRSPNPN
ncbi:hypothetical protein ACFXTI_000577 [Malus domestica]